MTEHGVAARFGNDPRALGPGRVMPYMLKVTAGQLGDPVVLFILMVSDDGLLHGL